MDSKQWRERAVATYERASSIDQDVPGSLWATELYARAGAEAAIATALAVGGGARDNDRKRKAGVDGATTEVVSHRRS